MPRTLTAPVVLLSAVALAGFAVVYPVNPSWALTMAAAGLTYGALSPLVAARRLYFLAGAAPHAALLAASLAIAAHHAFNAPLWPTALAAGIALVYTVGYAIFKGVDPDVATSIFVGASSAAAVTTIYYILSKYPVAGGVMAVFIGDPLLAGSRDIALALAIAAVTVGVAAATFREQVYIGVDRDDARLAGLKLWAYDLALFTSIALATVGLIRIVGFVLEHILILIPAAAARTAARAAGEALTLSITMTLAATSAGMAMAIKANIAPSGAAGGLLLAIYALILALTRGR